MLKVRVESGVGPGNLYTSAPGPQKCIIKLYIDHSGMSNHVSSSYSV